jgi:hypothetical protein
VAPSSRHPLPGRISSLGLLLALVTGRSPALPVAHDNRIPPTLSPLPRPFLPRLLSLPPPLCYRGSPPSQQATLSLITMATTTALNPNNNSQRKGGRGGYNTENTPSVLQTINPRPEQVRWPYSSAKRKMSNPPGTDAREKRSRCCSDSCGVHRPRRITPYRATI